MTDEKITIEDLGGMIKRGFDENTKQHQEMLKILNKHAVILVDHTEILKNHTEILKGIETKLEGVVYREEFEKLQIRVKALEGALAVSA